MLGSPGLSNGGWCAPPTVGAEPVGMSEQGALHVRLIAPPDVRVRRVMEHRWLREASAKQVVAESDARHRRFYEDFFGADWADPLDYHLTVNSGRLGPAAVDLVAFAAGRRWAKEEGA